MPDITGTVFVDAVLAAQDLAQFKYGAFENRLSKYGIVDNFFQNAPLLAPMGELESLRSSARRPVKLTQIHKESGVLVTVRTCTPAAVVKHSAFETLVFATVGFNLTTIPALHADNYVRQVELLASQMLDGIKVVYEQLDALALASLEANKTTTFSYDPTYANDGSAYRIPFVDKTEFYQNVPALFLAHDLGSDMVQDISGTPTIVNQNFLQSQGQANSINQGFAFKRTEGDAELSGRIIVPDFDFFHSNRIVNGVGVDETHWLIKPGATGIVDWKDIDSGMQNRVHEGKRWFKANDAVFGEEWGVYETRECVDASAQLAGLQATLQIKQQWTKDFALFTAFSSDSDSAIIKAEILS